jgi:RHS repeat-associated protein
MANKQIYTVGGTVQAGGGVYIPRSSDDELFEHCRASEFCYVLTARQMGKSSLMVRTAERLAAENVRTVILDLTKLGTTLSAEQWYLGLVDVIVEQLDLNVDYADWWWQHAHLGATQRLSQFLRQVVLERVTTPIVIFVDEIDTTRSLRFSDDFFATIRACYNARSSDPAYHRLSFVLLGVATPGDLIRDSQRTPFNIGYRIDLSDFTLEQSLPLAEGLGSPPAKARSALGWVLEWTHGHPYLTQRLCRALAEHSSKRVDKATVAMVVEQTFLSELSQQDNNLQFVRDSILAHPQRRQLLSLYQLIFKGKHIRDDKLSWAQSQLRLSGLVIVENGYLHIHNEIYRKVFNLTWIKSHTAINWTPLIVGVSLGVTALALSYIVWNAWVVNQSQVTVARFYQSGSAQERAASLAKLFRLHGLFIPIDNTFTARQLFYGLTQEEQLELFSPYSHVNSSDLLVIIRGLYTTLADIDDTNSTLALLRAMSNALDNKFAEASVIKKEIESWLQGRELANQRHFDEALTEYNNAIALNANNPATLYERARVLTALSKYAEALSSLDLVLAIAKNSPSPTSTPSPLPLTTPTEELTLTHQVTPKATSTQLTTATLISLTATPKQGITTTGPPLATTSITSSPPLVQLASTNSAKTTSSAVIFTATQEQSTTQPPPVTLTPTSTPSPTETPTLTPTPASQAIRSRFSTTTEIIGAIRDFISSNLSLTNTLARANASEYPNLMAFGLMPLDQVLTPDSGVGFTQIPPITPVSAATVLSTQGGTLQDPDRNITVNVRSGAVTSQVQLTYRQVRWHHPIPPAYADAHFYFVLSATRLADNVNLDLLRVVPPSGGNLSLENGPDNLAITVRYADGVVPKNLVSDLALAWFNPSVSAWVFLDSTVDPLSHTVTGYTDRLGNFALLTSPKKLVSFPQGAIIVDDDNGENNEIDGIFMRSGPSNSWWERQDSSSTGGKMWFTYNTDVYPARTSWATWTTSPLRQAGDYTIFACIPLINAETQSALYHITYPGGTASLQVDQLANRGNCINLGRYAYTQGSQGQVYLDDVASESLSSLLVRIGYDAMVWLPSDVTWSPSPNLAPYDPRWAQLGLQEWSGSDGKLISTAFGNFHAQNQDLYVPGVGVNVDFTRTYNSYDTRLGSFGLGWSYTYDIRAMDRGNGEVIVTLADGRTGLYKPDGNGGYKRPAGFFGTLTRADGKLTLTDVDQTVYIFNPDGALANIADANSNRVSFSYDSEGYTLTDTIGRNFRVDFNTDGYVSQITDPIGRIYTYEYKDGKLLAFHNAGDGTTQYTYDNQGRMESVIDSNNHTVVTNHYDNLGRVDRQFDASQSTTRFIYQDNPRVTTIIDGEGHQTIHEFDDQYRLIKERDALGNTVEYQYDDDNNRTYIKDRNGYETFVKYDGPNLVEVKDAMGQIAAFKYNAQNNLIYTRNGSGAETVLEYDEHGNLLHVQDAEGGNTYLTYFNNGLPRSLADAINHQTQFSYDADGNLEKVENAAHNITSFEYDDVGRRTAMTDANGRNVKFEHDPNNHIVRIIDPKGQPTVFTYDGMGNLTSFTDRRGGQTTYTYDENNSLVRVIDPLGQAITLTYDKLYHCLSFTNQRGFTTTYAYDAVYNLMQVTDAKGNLTQLDYDADHNLISITDALNQLTKFEYDSLHRIVKFSDVLGSVTEYSYDPLGNLVQVKDPKGGITQYAYDRLSRLLKHTDALLDVITFSYDPVGNRLSTTDALGYTTQYTYDSLNRLTKQTSPLGYTWLLSYDGVGNLISAINPRGSTTAFAYDGNDNLRQTADALNGVVTYTYDEEDNPLSVTDQNGNVTEFTYDELGNLRSLTLPMGQITKFEYDENSNLITVVNAKGKVTRFAYDELDLLKSETNPLNFITFYDHDALGRLTKVTDAEGHAMQYGYDAFDRLTEVIDGLNGRTKYVYDPLGNLTAFTDANGYRTTFDVDLLGRVTRETNPLGNNWQYTYDSVGNLVKRTDANGIVTHYTFDADNRLTQIAYPSGPGMKLSYDENGNLVGMVDISGTSAFTYDELNRLTEVQRQSGIMAQTTLGYTYDAVGNRTKIAYPDGKVVAYSYSANNWLTSVVDPLNGSTVYQYDSTGLPTHIAYPNSTWAAYTYDDADRLVKLFNGRPGGNTDVISSFDYTLDKVGNRVRTVENVTRGQLVTWTKDYTYDNLYRLLKAVETPNVESYQVLTSVFTYDAVGNRLSMTTNIADKFNTPALPSVVTTNYTYNQANEMLTAGAVNFTYDGNGNRISMSGPTRAINYTYNIENQLISAQTFDVLENGRLQSDSTLDFAYDGLGRRMQRGVVDGGIRKMASFLYDGLSYDLLAQYVDPGSPRATFYYRDLAQIISRHEIQADGSGLQYFYHYDGSGNVGAWTNQSGNEVQEYTYAPYGRLIDNNGLDNSSSRTDPHNSLTFSSKSWDQETELYYFGARDYDPATGTWLEQAPYPGWLVEPLTLHRYGYVENNPINLIDYYGFYIKLRDERIDINNWLSFNKATVGNNEFRIFSSPLCEPIILNETVIAPIRGAKCQVINGDFVTSTLGTITKADHCSHDASLSRLTGRDLAFNLAANPYDQVLTTPVSISLYPKFPTDYAPCWVSLSVQLEEYSQLPTEFKKFSSLSLDQDVFQILLPQLIQKTR